MHKNYFKFNKEYSNIITKGDIKQILSMFCTYPPHSRKLTITGNEFYGIF